MKARVTVAVEVAFCVNAKLLAGMLADYTFVDIITCFAYWIVSETRGAQTFVWSGSVFTFIWNTKRLFLVTSTVAGPGSWYSYEYSNRYFWFSTCYKFVDILLCSNKTERKRSNRHIILHHFSVQFINFKSLTSRLEMASTWKHNYAEIFRILVWKRFRIWGTRNPIKPPKITKWGARLGVNEVLVKRVNKRWITSLSLYEDFTLNVLNLFTQELLSFSYMNPRNKLHRSKAFKWFSCVANGYLSFLRRFVKLGHKQNENEKNLTGRGYAVPVWTEVEFTWAVVGKCLTLINVQTGVSVYCQLVSRTARTIIRGLCIVATKFTASIIKTAFVCI